MTYPDPHHGAACAASPRGARRALCLLSAVLLSVAVALVAPSPAGAATTFTLARTQKVSGSPAAGAQSCQHKDVTLPKLSSSNRYAWAEFFPQAGTDSLTNFHQTFSGKFYWTVCIVSMKGRSSAWTYYEYSLLTGETAACENDGHCTTYELQSKYLFVNTASYEWGSQLYVVPSDECTGESCQAQGDVTVSKT